MAQKDQAPSVKEIEKQVDALDKRVDRLRSLYEQYFQGIERVEPHMERETIKHLIQDTRNIVIRNTSLRFRINQMVAKFNTYETYWNRVTRQIEEGTYQRDLFKARYHARLRATAEQSDQEPAGPAAAPAGSAPPEKPAISDADVHALYEAYATAKRSCQEPVKGLTPETLGATLRKQVVNIIKQYKCKSVEFKVIIKDGKAVLKAVPRF